MVITAAYFTPMIEYGTGSALAGSLCFLAWKWDVTRAWLIVVGSWLAWCAFIIGSMALDMPNYDPWQFGIFETSVAGWLLLRRPYSRIRATIGAVFFLQAMMHIAFGAQETFGDGGDTVLYRQFNDITGWIQLFLLGGWASGTGLWRLDPAFRRDVARLGRSPHLGNHGGAR